MIIEQFTDESGAIRIRWQASESMVFSYKFDTQPTVETLQAMGARSIILEQVNSTQPIDFGGKVRPDIALSFAEKCRELPSMSSSQYNAWVSGYPWSDEAFVRYFVSEFAREMQNRGYVELQSSTENAHMQAARDYINSVPAEIFNRLIGL